MSNPTDKPTFFQREGIVIRWYGGGRGADIWRKSMGAWVRHIPNLFDMQGITEAKAQSLIGEGNDLYAPVKDAEDPEQGDLADQFDQAREDAKRTGGTVWVPQEPDPHPEDITYGDTWEDGTPVGTEDWVPTPGWEERVDAVLRERSQGIAEGDDEHKDT